MESFTVVNNTVAALKQHLPALQHPAARALHDTVGAALQRRGEAHLLARFAARPAEEADLKRALRQAVRDDPQLGAWLSGASAALANADPVFAPQPSPAPPPAAHQASPPALPATAHEQLSPVPEPQLNRLDLIAAISATPPAVRQAIVLGAARCLDLLDTNLPADEQITAVSSASLKPDTTVNCLLVLTDRRLIFIAPRPQVVAFRLASIRRSQANLGYFFLEGDAGEYSVGLAPDDWARQFEQRVFDASALAVLTSSERP